MNKHSIIRFIAIFFFLIFFLINGLFIIAHQHFSKKQELDQIQRFLLADRLLHDKNNDFSMELAHLMIRPSTLSDELLQTEGKTVLELPFGKIISLESHTYFLNLPPPEHPKHLLPPPYEREFTPFVLEDIAQSSLALFWIIVSLVDILILLFFFYLMKKLLPLHRLKNAIIAFQDGDISLDLTLHGNDEISQITHEFNLTLEKIASMREARSLFLRNILHELKTPIMKGSLTAECLENSIEKERLERIFIRMNYLLNEFAKMEHLNSGEWHLNMQEYRFVDLLDHVCDMLLCEKELMLIEGEDSDLILCVDFELFTIALKNLLDNTFKYSNQRPKLTISQSAITIASIGEELSKEKQNFSKPFNREFENSSAGLGLGLYISDSIIKKHNFHLAYMYKDGYNCFSIIF